MILVIVSFIAGAFSVLAPCILPMIPVLLARGVNANRRSAWWVIGGLVSSIFLFSILLKSTTLLIDIPQSAWSVISGVIVAIFGVTMAFPRLWERVSERLSLRAQQGMAAAGKERGRWGDVLLGASLGPVFSACSPTYLLIVAVILPQEPLAGVGYLLVFLAGLAMALGLVAALGSGLVRRLGWSMDPDGIFRRSVGVVLIVVGVMLATGFDKSILSWLVSQGWFDWQVELESRLAQ